MDASPYLPAPLRRLVQWRAPTEWFSTFTWGGALVFGWAVFLTMPPKTTPHLFGGHVVWYFHVWQRLEIAMLMAVPIVFCRRWPLTGLAAMLGAMTLLPFLGLAPPVLIFGAAALVAVISANRPRWVGLVAAVTTFTASPVQHWINHPFNAASFSGGEMGNVILLLAVAFIGGVLIRERREHGRALREQAAESAVTAERLRIARELHDMVAHSIGIVTIQAGAAKRCISTQPVLAAQALDVIETTSRETLTGLRHMLVALRKAENDRDNSAPMPGLQDVQALADNAAKAGVAVQVRWGGERRALPAEVDLSAYRIVQESVTNVVRHAGTRQCRVGIVFGADEVVIEVVDDGRGTVADAGRAVGFGLAGMRERVSLLHGSFEAGPRPKGGFRVEARIPA